MKKQFSEQAKPYRSKSKAQERPRIGMPPKPGRKRAVNVAIDENILSEARAQGINLSQLLEDNLRDRVRAEKVKCWQEESREAIKSYNRFIAEHGIWSKKYRSW
jgi:antitoxin CcdA